VSLYHLPAIGLLLDTVYLRVNSVPMLIDQITSHALEYSCRMFTTLHVDGMSLPKGVSCGRMWTEGRG